MGVLKGAASQVHRHPVLNTQRPLSVAVTKASMPISAAMPKPRPPPTASPLVAPGSKAGVSTPPSSLLKGSNNKAISDALIITSSQSRPLTIQSPAANVSKTFQTSRLVMTPQSKSSPSLTQTLPGAQPQPQSNFITPMHATLTKSTHSSIPPIVKLTPRTQNAVITTAATSAATSVSLTPRSQAAPSIHQYPPKTLAGYRLPFSGSTGGSAKQGPGSYPSPSSQKSPSINSSTSTSLINTSSISKHSGTSASPAVASAAPGQRQRIGGGTPQGSKPVVSVPPVPLSSVSSQLPQVCADRFKRRRVMGEDVKSVFRSGLLDGGRGSAQLSLISSPRLCWHAGGPGARLPAVPVPGHAEPSSDGHRGLQHGGQQLGGRQQQHPLLHSDPE